MSLSPAHLPLVDADGANLDPRNCDCGKGACCPLLTSAWIDWGRSVNLDLAALLDTWVGELADPVIPAYGIVDLRNGYVWTRDHLDAHYLTEEHAAADARERNRSVYGAAQSYRVVRLERVLGAQVKP